MKSRLFILFLALSFVRCNDFLEEKSQDEIRPSTVTDMSKIMESEAYFSIGEGALFNRKTDIFTDDITCAVVEDVSYQIQKEQDHWRYRWDAKMFDEGGGGEDLSFWKIPYERIKGCNVVLEYVDGMQGDEMRREHLKGEAYALRGFYYYMLVNFFGLPYNYGDPTQNLGVPLKLVSGVTAELFVRNTVAECYAQIVKDLELGAELMEKNKEVHQTKLHLTYLAAHALLSRVYLHMENWNKVIESADAVLNEYPELLDMKTTPSSSGVYDERSNVEVLWAGPEKALDQPDQLAAYPNSMDLSSVYDIDNDGSTDKRRESGKTSSFLHNSWMAPELGYFYVYKGWGNLYYTNGGVRTAEAYINRAEAYIRKYMESKNREEAQKGLDDLNTLRNHRIVGNVDKVLEDFATPEELLNFCLRERRRELCGEANHRWFDLRRLGMPEIKHIYVDDQNGHQTVHTLQKEDPRYVLPIPERVIEKNPNLREK